MKKKLSKTIFNIIFIKILNFCFATSFTLESDENTLEMAHSLSCFFLKLQFYCKEQKLKN